ncbi:pantoate--beta-alanine ligase [bacterium]|nr:pantoate--beta-alanine ligase [bacterium]MBU1064296.1 pantoate--beta-alanine ligase [bacterium]MBU1635138.1 pantoate--beta-alanine ligase [bacterium]MBU1875159.1 pantoate--beta-alanine ligase [bacterium]
MQVIKKIDNLRVILGKYRKIGKRIALVPTMGYFHAGHLSLIDAIRKKADIVVLSLFVNPMQFGPGEDLVRYPRDFERDERLARERGADIIFYPEACDMYTELFSTYVVTDQLSEVLCGKSRPVHFKGVTTVVAKLFNIVQPDVAVFGRKDVQQAIIIQRMVADLNFPIEIIVVPIVREPDGLAMSSRNIYLSENERKQAPVIQAALQNALETVKNGETSAEKIRQLVQHKIESAALARIEYIEVIRERDLQPVDRIEPGTFIAVAVWFGKTRLIDNLGLLI